MAHRISSNLIAHLLVVGLILATGLSATPAHAQSSEGIEIKPGIVEDRVNPGDTYRFVLNVKNLFDTEQTFFLVKQDISGVDDESRPIFAPEGTATGYELSQWISASAESITLRPGESQGVQFTVQVPKEATPGSHFGGVFFALQPTKPGETGTGIGIQVGAVVSLRISGDITEDARLREFSTEKFVYDSANVTFRVRVEDLGNVLLRPHGLIEVSDMRGRQIASVRVNDTGAPVFPGTSRVYTPEWSYDRFAFGRYQAVLSLTYGEDGRKTVSSVTSFWVLPIKPILLVLGSLLGFVIVLFFLMRVYIRRKLREMGISSARGEADYYEKKYNRSPARMVILTSAIFLFLIVCLTALFLMFA